MELWEWQYQGACRDADDTLFFHPEGERGSTRRRRAEAAKAICRTCPVMMQCREESLARRERHGTWGGLSEDERDRIFRGKKVAA
jgi:WhiB family redox-sensing transcriptional regulator